MPKYTQEVHLLNHPDYMRYKEKKDAIYEKYPPLNKMSREEYKQCMREITDLIFEPDGDYQKWAWDAMGEQDKIRMERRALGKKTYTRTKASDNVEYKSPYDDF